jgi:hypothetical protein
MIKAVFLLLLWTGLGCAPASAAEAGIGIVTAVKGAVTLNRGPLQLMDQLRQPGLVRVPAGGELVVFVYRGAREYTLGGPGDFAVSMSGIARNGAAGTLAMKRMDPLFAGISAPPAGVVQAGATLRGADTAAGQDEAVDASQPVLRWPAREHIGNYQVVLADAGDRVLYRAEASANEATPPELVRLAPGARYRLELTWREPGGQLRMTARHFSTLDAVQAQAVARLRPDAGASPASRVLFGLWLRSLGAWSMAKPFLEQ